MFHCIKTITSLHYNTPKPALNINITQDDQFELFCAVLPKQKYLDLPSP